MAYNPYSYFQPNFQQNYQPNQMQNGFVSVRTIEEAYNWPVAPGNSITFKVENTPYVCTKTKGFSPLETPVFERYRLVKEEAPQRPQEVPSEPFDAQSQIKLLWDEVTALKGLIEGGNDVQPSDDDAVPTVHEQSTAVHEKHGHSRKPTKQSTRNNSIYDE